MDKSELNTALSSIMSDSSYDTIVMENSHDPKIDDGLTSNVRPDVDSSVIVSNNVYIVL